MRGLTFKKRDWLILLAALMLCAVAAFLLWPRDKGNIAIVTYRGQKVTEISLAKDSIYSVEGDFTVTLEVKDSRIRFIHSACPNHICENYFGWIGLEGEFAVCDPAGVAVQISSG